MEHGLEAKERNMNWIIGLGITALAMVAVLGIAQQPDEETVAEIRRELIPEEGAATAYGIPLSLNSLPQFVDWWYTIASAAEADPRYRDALSGLVAPCCDDNTAFRCCCETDGRACNVIRSGKGLAAHLVLDLGLDADAVRENVLQWFRFARPDYYVAAELEARGLSAIPYGLTTEGSCYRRMCDTPISGGGCGGMEQLIEPAIESDIG